jgi:hypothetical protein
MIWRGYNEYVYTTCSRCQRKVPIGECVWDNGLLVCKVYDCADRLINGSFEYAYTQEASRDRQELNPDDKLIHPEDVTLQIQRVAASAGTY